MSQQEEQKGDSEQQVAYPSNSVIFREHAKALDFFCKETEAGRKIFRVSETEIPFAHAYRLHDIKTLERTSEERLLIKHPKYLYNMRRGTAFLADHSIITLLKSTLPDHIPKGLHIEFARRGMIKFFDLLPEYLAPDFPIPNVDNRANHLLYPVVEGYRRGNKVELYTMRKANGESAQVSFNGMLDAWMISSKNVSICVRNKEDLKGYEQPSLGQEDKFLFARQIAEVWLKEVERIEKNSLLEELKAELKGKSLVGEFVGHPDHQHLVGYPKIDLHFYSLTNHEKIYTAMDPEIAQKVIKKFGLNSVKFSSLGIFATFDQLRTRLIEYYIEMAGGSMGCEEEGVVLYFVQRSGKPEEDFALSLCKLKTMEYTIYRMLREILREICTVKSGSKKVIRPSKDKPPSAERFLMEIKEMANGWFGNLLKITGSTTTPEMHLPKPLDFYRQLGEKVFQYIGKLESKDDIKKIVKEKYAEFICTFLEDIQYIATFTTMLNTDALFSYIVKTSAPCCLLIVPPFALQLEKETMSFSDILREEKPVVKECLIEMAQVPRIHIEWKKHAEALKKCQVIIFGHWDDYQEYSARIKASTSNPKGTRELREIQRYQEYQLEKLWRDSLANIKLFKQAQEKGFTGIKFIDDTGEIKKIFNIA